MASSSTGAASFELELLQFMKARGCDVAGSQPYRYPCHVNPASFVSIRLFNHKNFGPWKEQMMCLMKSHDMLGFINGKYKNPKEVPNHHSKEEADKRIEEAKYAEWERSDALAKGWIFGSLSEDVMHDVVGCHTANDVWKRLETTYGTLPEATLDSPTTSDNAYWEKVQEVLDKDKTALTAKLNGEGDTALHFAVHSDRIHLLKNLLRKINPESLPTLVRYDGQNILHVAAEVGNTDAAKMVVEKNPHLLFMVDNHERLPILNAILGPHRTTFQYLLQVSKQHIGLSKQYGYHSPFEGIYGSVLINKVMHEELFDVAYEMIKEYPAMAVTIDKNATPLFSTTKMLAYYSGTGYNFYQRILYSCIPIVNDHVDDAEKLPDIENQVRYKAKVVTKCMRSCFLPAVLQRIYVKFWKFTILHVSHIKRLQEDKVKHNAALKLLKCICEESDRQINSSKDIAYATVDAVINDTPEVIKEIVHFFPQATLVKHDGHHLLQLAVINRSDKVYKFLVHQMSDHKNLHQIFKDKDKDKNNLLHLVAKLAPIHKLNVVSGAALQMQRELQWFQEVEKFSIPKDKKEKNSKQETPFMVFRREHKELRKEGEEWMKKTADSYTITAALIVTIVFAAAITVPGGNDGNNGKAIYRAKPSFIIFVVSDAIALFTSTTSLLLFLSILTARYAEQDFLYALPKRLIVGLATLFLSVTSMMVAFSATLYLMFEQGKTRVLIPIAVLTCLPIASFVTLQFPLLLELISSTYGHRMFGKQSDPRINPHH